MPAFAWPARDADHLLVSSAQMAALEEQLFASGLPVEALMEKAALGVTQRLRQPDWWPQLQQRGALVLAGPGHNGGDGLVVARELQLAGISVRIWSPFERRKPLTAAHLSHARWLGIAQLQSDPDPADPAIWIDALFGIGQSRAPGERLETLLLQRQEQQPHQLISIDGPTGLCADRGVVLGQTAACASLSLSIGLLKQGFLQDQALAWVGQLERIDLGLPRALLDQLPPNQLLSLKADDLSSAGWPQLAPAATKYERGRLLVIAGSETYQGASQLCLQGASASGVGSLRAALPQQLADQLWDSQPHVVLSAGLPAHANGSLNIQPIARTVLERLDAVVIGPGLGDSIDETDDWEPLQRFTGLLVIDADGLNRIAALGGPPWLRQRQGPTWLTPHRGELARLFPDLGTQSALDAATAAAEASGCSVLLKGARTVIAGANGRRWQILQASGAAARAGLGDVLAGYCGGIGARSMAAGLGADAVFLALSALAHANAGEQATREQGCGGATPMATANYLRHQENS